MKTFIAITSFALTIGLSGVAHAGFNDQGPMIDTTPARAARQDLSQVPVVHGFNQQSHHAVAATPASRRGNDAMTLGTNCELNPRFGFQNSNSGVSC
ncbi:MAG: hypothetical protein KDJ54_08670 [Candidatus Competibacteraceae bacterium]|nr:hypothetical protein [Candidatus Competibacteraceae bacterium]